MLNSEEDSKNNASEVAPTQERRVEDHLTGTKKTINNRYDFGYLFDATDGNPDI